MTLLLNKYTYEENVCNHISYVKDVRFAKFIFKESLLSFWQTEDVTVLITDYIQ